MFMVMAAFCPPTVLSFWEGPDRWRNQYHVRMRIPPISGRAAPQRNSGSSVAIAAANRSSIRAPSAPTAKSTDLSWEVSDGKGVIHSVTTVHRGPSVAFKEDSPFQVALVDMDEGFRFMANVRGGEAEIGTKVRVLYEKRGDQTIPQVEIRG